jgi:hypothetical protein
VFRLRRIILTVLGLSAAAMASYPPYIFQIPGAKAGESTYPSRYRFAGYAPIYSPPETEDWINYPVPQPAPQSIGNGDVFEQLKHSQYIDAFNDRHKRDNIISAHIDVVRLSVQMFAVATLGCVTWMLGIRRP